MRIRDFDLSADPRAVLFVNTHSRRGQEWYEESRSLLSQMGLSLVRSEAFQEIGQLQSAVKEAVVAGMPRVIVGGGDGTFSSIVRFFVDSPTVLGVLPLGTGNAFARDLGIPSDLVEASRTIAAGKMATVDLGRLADDYFLNVATVGLTTNIAQSLTKEEKRRFGRFVYAFALMRGLRQVGSFDVRIETENGVDEFRTLQVVIGNGRFHAGPFPLSPEASITEGKLSLYALATESRAAFIKLALALRTGRHGELPEVHAQETTGGTLTTTPVLPVTVDGEVCASTPTRFSVVPDTLRVMVPLRFDA